jgi:hypothetical protein
MMSATARGAVVPADEPAGSARALPAALDDSLFLAIVLSWVAAAIHVVAAFDHAEEAASHAVFFALLAVAQVAWGIAVYRQGGRAVLVSGVVLSILVAILWAASRTTGLPIGPERWTAEPVGALDVLATGSELALAAIVVCQLGMARGSALARHARTPLLAAGTCLVLLSAVALTVGGGHSH